MAAVESVSAEARDRAGKGAARESRRNGRVPAVIYGDKKEPTLISLDPKEIDRLIHKKTFYATLLDVDLKGTKHRVLPRDVQFDPVTDRTLHVDFQRIGKDTKVHVNVPVVVRNEDGALGVLGLEDVSRIASVTDNLARGGVRRQAAPSPETQA